MRIVIQMLVLFFIGTTSCFAYINENYRVEGLAPGEYVVFSSKQYKSYKCTPSDIGDLTWCRKSEKRKFIGQTVDTYTSISHRDDGEVLYISYTMSGVKIDDNLSREQIGYLQHFMGQQPQLLRLNTRTASMKTGVIATWGSIDLTPLRTDERLMIDEGQSTGKGYLIDYLTSPKTSVRERLPVYSISSGYGYIYLLSKGPSGKGTISFRAINNQAILAEIAKSSVGVTDAIAELQDGFAEVSEMSSNLDGPHKQAFDQLLKDFSHDKNINNRTQVEQYNRKLSAITSRLEQQLADQGERQKFLDILQPMRRDLTEMNVASLDETLASDHQLILARISVIEKSEVIKQAQLSEVEAQFKDFTQRKTVSDRRKALTAKLALTAESLEKDADKFTDTADQDSARTLVLKIKAINAETSYQDLEVIDGQAKAHEVKMTELRQFQSLSEDAVRLIEKIESELKNVIDDGEVVQNLKADIEEVRGVMKSQNLENLKIKVTALANTYERSKRDLKEKTFDTF